METSSGKKKLTRGEKMLLVAPLFVLLLLGVWPFKPLLLQRLYGCDFFDPHGNVYRIMPSPDGKQIVSASLYGDDPFYLTAWNIQLKQKLWSVPTPYYSGRNLIFSSNSKYIASFGSHWSAQNVGSSSLQVRSASSGELLWPKAARNYVNAIAFTPDSKQLIVVRNDSIETYNVADGTTQRQIQNTNSAFSSPAQFARDGKSVITRRILPPQDPLPAGGFPGGPPGVAAIPTFNFYTVKDPRDLSVLETWNLQSGRKQRVSVPLEIRWYEIGGRKNEVVVAATSKDSSKSSLGLTQIWNYQTGKLVHTLPGADAKRDFTSRHCISNDGRFLFRIKGHYATRAAATNREATYKVQTINLWTGKQMWGKALRYTPRVCRFSPDSQLIGIVETDDSDEAVNRHSLAHLWHAKTGATFKEFRKNSDRMPIIFTSDSRYLIHSTQSQIYLWRVK